MPLDKELALFVLQLLQCYQQTRTSLAQSQLTAATHYTVHVSFLYIMSIQLAKLCKRLHKRAALLA